MAGAIWGIVKTANAFGNSASTRRIPRLWCSRACSCHCCTWRSNFIAETTGSTTVTASDFRSAKNTRQQTQKKHSIGRQMEIPDLRIKIQWLPIEFQLPVIWVTIRASTQLECLGNKSADRRVRVKLHLDRRSINYHGDRTFGHNNLQNPFDLPHRGCLLNKLSPMENVDNSLFFKHTKYKK